MKIALDFDGAVVDHQFPRIGTNVPGVVDALTQLQDAGAQFMLWTVRSNKTLLEAVKWFRTHKIRLYGVNENPDQKYWAQGPKMYAPVYIDDAAFGAPLIQPKGFNRPCIDWSRVLPDLLKRLETA